MLDEFESFVIALCLRTSSVFSYVLLFVLGDFSVLPGLLGFRTSFAHLPLS